MILAPPPDELESSHPNDRVLASDAEREGVVEHLRTASTEGRLTVDELEHRTAQALAARTRTELSPLTRDLPSAADVKPSRAAASARTRRPKRNELAAYIAVNLVLIAIWAATGAGYFWPIWPLLGWGIGLATHGRAMCGTRRPPQRLSQGPRSTV